MAGQRTAKARGSSAERELLHALYDHGWGAVRAAGSGSVPLEVPDIIAGGDGRVVAIEAKYCAGDRQYFTMQEITDLKEFSRRFGAEAWVAVKFTRRGWHLVPAHTLLSSGKNYVLSYADAKERARDIARFIAPRAATAAPEIPA